MAATFDFTGAGLPAGATLTRAAGPWSRTKRVEDTTIDFTAGVLPPGVTVQRLEGPWSRRGERGTIVKGTAANTPRFDYDPPVENRIASSAVAQVIYSDQSNMTTTQSGDVTKYVVGPTPSGNYNMEYFNTGGSEPLSTYAVDLRGESGGEVLYLLAQGSSAPFKRIVLTTNWQRFDFTSPAGGQYWGFGVHNAGMHPAEARPAQTYYARRRQLNRGPVALAYAETTGTARYEPPVCRGLMLEPERTNYVFPSMAFAKNVDGWLGTGNAVTTGVTAPDGGGSSTLVTGSGPYIAYRSVSANAVAGEIFTASSFDKKAAASTYRLGIGDVGDTPGADITLTDAWTRHSFSRAYPSGGSGSGFFEYFGPSDGSSASLYAWGAQLERGAQPSSYIPTTTGPATRPGEEINIAAPAFATADGFGATPVVVTFADGSTYTYDAQIQAGYVNIKSVSLPPCVIASIRIMGQPSGIMELGIAADVPRFEHDPVTGARLGLLVEPERTNLLAGGKFLQGPGWITEMDQRSVTTGRGGTPDLSRFTLRAGAFGSRSFSVNAPAVPSIGSVISTSMFVRRGPKINLAYIREESGHYVGVDMRTGATLASPNAVVSMSAGGTRLAATYTRTGGNYAFFQVTIAENLTPSGSNHNDSGPNFPVTGAETAEWGGAQMELGDRPTSYIPTTDAPATRPADVLTLDLAPKGVEDGKARAVVTYAGGAEQLVGITVAGGKTTIPTADLTQSCVRTVAIVTVNVPLSRTAVLRDSYPRSLTL